MTDPVPADWLPTPEAINALPDPVRRYIHGLETRCDPAGDVAQLILLKETVQGLAKAVEEAESALRFSEQQRTGLVKRWRKYASGQGAITADAFFRCADELEALATTPATCHRCLGTRWICEAHPDRPWPHDDCAGPGVPCPVCNTEEPPQTPPGFRSYVRPETKEPSR